MAGAGCQGRETEGSQILVSASWAAPRGAEAGRVGEGERRDAQS